MKCCICGKTFKGFGNNPDPLNDEKGQLFKEDCRCCNECDEMFVIPYRLAMIVRDSHHMRTIQNRVNFLRGHDTRRLYAIIETPEGHTYEQRIDNLGDKEKSVKQAQKILGKSYKIVEAYFED